MTASIAGSVTTHQGDPIIGVAVKLLHEPTGSAFASTSDATGHYQFTAVKAGGPYHLSLKTDSDVQELERINLKIDEELIHDFVV